MKSCLILTGGSVDLPTASLYLENNHYDLIIAVDGGMRAARALSLIPHFCVGDFDTIDQETFEYFRAMKEVSFDIHPSEKDENDTELAIRVAMEEGADQIHVFGATGSRMDHTLASIGLLAGPLKAGIDCVMIDKNNRICMCKDRFVLKRSEAFGKYLSLLPHTDVVNGISARGVKYPLDHYDMEKGNSLGVSNEIIEEEAVITLTDGLLLIIQSGD